MKDRPLKALLFEHLWVQRCIVQPELQVYFDAGASGDKKFVTDVDVFALRPHPQIRFERILGDCRTLGGQSPINRALWLRGLMAMLGSENGYLLLENPSIEPDHKLAANSFGVVLLGSGEFKNYDTAILYPEGSGSASVTLQDVLELQGLSRRFPRLEPLMRHVYRDGWHEVGDVALIRHSLGALSRSRRELDPDRPDHLAAVCDAVAVLSIGVADCVGRIFHQYLQPDQKDILSEALQVIIWGGREQYQYYLNLRRRLAESRAQGELKLESLQLPEWDRFLQVIREMLERPSDGLLVPWILRHFAVDCLRERQPLKDVTSKDNLALKYSMLITEWACRAALLPPQFVSILVERLVKAQGDLAASQASNGKSKSQLEKSS